MGLSAWGWSPSKMVWTPLDCATYMRSASVVAPTSSEDMLAICLCCRRHASASMHCSCLHSSYLSAVQGSQWLWCRTAGRPLPDGGSSWNPAPCLSLAGGASCRLHLGGARRLASCLSEFKSELLCQRSRATCFVRGQEQAAGRQSIPAASVLVSSSWLDSSTNAQHAYSTRSALPTAGR